MIEAFLGLPAHLRRRLAEALESGMVDTSSPLESLRSVVGLKQGGEDVMAGLGALQAMGVVGSAAAAWLRTVEDATSRMQRPDLVWSGPKVPGVHARDTRQVYEELLGSAERSIWASSYAYFDGPKAFHVLASRMDERPELRSHVAAQHPAKERRHDGSRRARPRIRRSILGEGLARVGPADDLLRSKDSRARRPIGCATRKSCCRR